MMVGVAGQTDELGENLPHCRDIHHNSHITLAVFECRLPRWKASDSRWSYSTIKQFSFVSHYVGHLTEFKMTDLKVHLRVGRRRSVSIAANFLFLHYLI
jgi:hypothetical protein